MYICTVSFFIHKYSKIYFIQKYFRATIHLQLKGEKNILLYSQHWEITIYHSISISEDSLLEHTLNLLSKHLGTRDSALCWSFRC